MTNTEIINKILFDWVSLQAEELKDYCAALPPKILRWLGAQHPDNRIRKIFFQVTNVQIGEDTVINPYLVISDDYEPLLIIGSRVAISPNVTIICASAPNNSELNTNSYVQQNLICKKEVIIQDDVWIGANAVILPGVVVGEKALSVPGQW